MFGTDSACRRPVGHKCCPAKAVFPPAQRRKIGRALQLPPQPGENLRAVKLYIGRDRNAVASAPAADRRKPRRGFPTASAACRGCDRGRRETQLHGFAVEPVLKSFGIEIARAFVEQRRHQISGTRPCRPDPARRRRQKAKSTVTSGTAVSCTSQASMPPGLTMRSIVVASAGAAEKPAPRMAADRRRTRASLPWRARRSEQRHGASQSVHERFSSGCRLFTR